MLISMQGNWTIGVKTKDAVFPQRFVVAGAASGNGTYNATVGMTPVSVTGSQWSIAILNDPGTGFRASDTRIKFPVISGGNFVFDIESNDAGSDKDFNDLVLTCSSAALVNDYLIYGNVTLYSNGCIFNPCFRRFLVIDTYSKFLKALENDKIKEVITKLYPERIPPIRINPNPPDPPPFFTPIMINLVDEVQLPEQLANVFRRIDQQTSNAKEARRSETNLLSDFQLESTVSLARNVTAPTAIQIDKVALGRLADTLKFVCTTEPGVNLTLNFAEYDRSVAELAGGPYTGTGDRTNLGSAITDMNGNYIFRFTQSFSELVNEIFEDVGSGEDVVVQARPDIIVSVTDSLHPSVNLFESAPFFNVPQIRRIDICLPLEKVQPSSLCFNGNLIGSLGNVFIGGTQNVTASTAPALLDRNGYNNHLHANGKISVHNTQALFAVDCACWAGAVDLKGCLFNIKRKKDDPIIRHYTIRYRKPGGSWQFVNETYLHPKFSKRFIPFYSGDQVGPFSTSLKVDGGPPQTVPAYINIQAEVFFDGIDWEFSNLDRYMQLHTSIYDGGVPGTVYFLVEGYDASGTLVSSPVIARDMIALYINNRKLDFGIGSVAFTSPIESLPCGLYKMTPSELNTPLTVQFKANDLWGFVDNYQFSIGKCPQLIEVDVTSPGSIAGTKSTGIIASGSNPGNTDAANCPGYTGTLGDFGTTGYVTVTLQPSASEGGWLRAGEQFAVISFGLSADMRKTNGYNTGIEGPYLSSTQFYVELK